MGEQVVDLASPVDLGSVGLGVDAAPAAEGSAQTKIEQSDIGVSSAFGSWREARGSLLQLLLNIVVLIVVGLLTLKFVRLLWRRINDRRIGNR